jgi:hypothetical protein
MKIVMIFYRLAKFIKRWYSGVNSEICLGILAHSQLNRMMIGGICILPLTGFFDKIYY